MDAGPRALGRALLLAGGLAAGLATAELALFAYDAIRPRPPPPPKRGYFWQRNPEFGWGHTPGREGYWWNDQREFYTAVRINSKGLRDVEHEHAKPAGVFRILILGDSYIEAVQVELEHTFPRRLEAALAQEGRTVEVINAGVSDWGTDNALLYYLHEGARYSADLVILAFTTANDVRNNSPTLNPRVPYVAIPKPTFTLRGDGELELHPAPPPTPRPPRVSPPWWQRRRVVTLLTDLVSKIGGTGASPCATRAGATTASIPTDMLVYASTYTPEVEEAWRITKALIRKLRDAVREHSAEFAVLVVNGPAAHIDQRWRRELQSDPVAQKTWRRTRPNEELSSFLRAEQIRSLDLFGPFEAAKSERRLFFDVDPHWTAEGHELAAKTVAGFLIADEHWGQ